MVHLSAPLVLAVVALSATSTIAAPFVIPMGNYGKSSKVNTFKPFGSPLFNKFPHFNKWQMIKDKFRIHTPSLHVPAFLKSKFFGKSFGPSVAEPPQSRELDEMEVFERDMELEVRAPKRHDKNRAVADGGLDFATGISPSRSRRVKLEERARGAGVAKALIRVAPAVLEQLPQFIPPQRQRRALDFEERSYGDLDELD